MEADGNAAPALGRPKATVRHTMPGCHGPECGPRNPVPHLSGTGARRPPTGEKCRNTGRTAAPTHGTAVCGGIITANFAVNTLHTSASTLGDTRAATQVAQHTTESARCHEWHVPDHRSRQHLLEVAHVREGVCEVGPTARSTFARRFEPRVLQCLGGREALVRLSGEELLHKVLRPAGVGRQSHMHASSVLPERHARLPY